MKCSGCGAWRDQRHKTFCKKQYEPACPEVQALAARSEIPDLQRVLEGAAKAGQRVKRFPGGFALMGAPPVWQERCGDAPPVGRQGSDNVDGKWHVISNARPIRAEAYGERDPAQPHTPGTYREKLDQVVREMHDAVGIAPPGQVDEAPAPMEETHRLCWRTPTGKLGFGPPTTEEAARLAANLNNRRWPDVPHWVEQVRAHGGVLAPRAPGGRLGTGTSDGGR